MKIDFKNEQVFHQLEEDAIAGSLLYDDFPPCEYKYFSKLSKLGFHNRHKGWSAEICLAKQEDYKKQYKSEKENFERFFNMACRMQESIRKGEELISRVYKAKSVEEKLKLSLEALERLTGEDGFAERNLNKVRSDTNE